MPIGSFIFIPIWVVHRDPLNWGDDADQFVPERFADTANDPIGRWLPFSAGARNCVGMVSWGVFGG